MSGKKKSIPPAKKHFVGVRMTEDMWKLLESRCASAGGISPSEYIRRLINDQTVVYKQEVVFNSTKLLHALRDLGRTGSNLNQIARHLNQGGQFTEEVREDVLKSIDELHQMREEIKKMAGEYRGDC